MRKGIACLLLGALGVLIAAGSSGPLLLFQNGGTALGASPTLNCSTGLTCSMVGGVATITAAGGSGTVTSVDMSVPSDLSVSGNPITTSGTLAITRNNIYRVTGSDFSTTATLQSTITGLSINTAANTDYYGHCALAAVGTSTSGVIALVNASQATTIAGYEIADPASTVTTTVAIATGVACTSGCSTTTRPIMIDFMLHTNGNAGTLAIQAAASTAGQTALVKVGSFCMIWTP